MSVPWERSRQDLVVRGPADYGVRLDAVNDEEVHEVLPPYTPRSSTQSRQIGLLRAFRSQENDSFTEAEYSEDDDDDEEEEGEDEARDPTSIFRRHGSRGVTGRRRRRSGRGGHLSMFYDKSPPAHRARVRFIRGFLYAGILYSAVWMILGWGLRKWVWRPQDGEGGHEGGGGPPWRGPPGRIPPKGDGEAVGCAHWDVENSREFDPAGWKFSGSISEDRDRDRDEDEDDLQAWNYRSINSTFSIPLLDNITSLTEDGKRRWLETFIHLNGPYAIGDVSIETVNWDEEREPEIGVLVQAIYRTTPVKEVSRREIDSYGDETTPDIPNTPDTPDTSDIPSTPEHPVDGWEELQRTSVCLMRRTGKENDTESSDKKKDDGWENPFEGRPGMGVGIYTETKFNETTRSDNSLAPLQFRLFVTVPLQAKGVTLNDHRYISVPSLDVRGSLVGMSLGDLKDVTFGMLSLRTAIGNVEIEHVVADFINVKTAGTISGHISVSNFVNVNSPMSDIDLDISLLSPVNGTLAWAGRLEDVPPFEDHGPPPPPPPHGFNKKHWNDNKPLRVRAETSKGNVKMTFVEWNMEARLLWNRVQSALGNIEVYHNASYVGPFSLSTTLGKVNLVEIEVEDPLGLDRHRIITSTRSDKIGEKTISGTVEWINSSAIVAAGSAGDSVADEHRPGPEDPWNSHLDIRTTLGNVKLVI